ncbi:uncharacterized protein STEHIDRAFT_112901 [Stereum hirsutum FP-91666 SS1]|uniref:uncharacterized protein n=1 Tax=Stereum hirsutum (strain FP-91666) TaxID=721885 RepID=UPI0004449B2D|nr:uncharacterized protein STEHIDRAFT_112901 [Stereum hirsutum FP-91666 SS1]EIM84558.1 hypothetical protein STEHIDRAFT_112901 [Stereum hirsutum FP-91666 SS1]
MLAANSSATPAPVDSTREDLDDDSLHLGCPLQSSFSHLIRKDQILTADAHPASNCSDRPSPAPTSTPSINQDSQSPPANETWDLIPYDVPWGREYQNYRPGVLPGPDGDCVFLRSPTPDSVEQHRKQRTVEACRNCRERHSKCSGTRPTCTRCIKKGLLCNYASETPPIKTEEACQCSGAHPACARCAVRGSVCQYASNNKHREHHPHTVVSCTSPASRVQNLRRVRKQLLLPKAGSPVVKELSVKQEKLDLDAIGFSLSLAGDHTPASPTSMSWESSTRSEESEGLNPFSHVSSYTVDSPTDGENDESIILPPYNQRPSLPHGELLSNASAFHSFPNPSSSAFVPNPIRQMVPTSLLEADSMRYVQPYEDVKPDQTNMFAAAASSPHESWALLWSTQWSETPYLPRMAPILSVARVRTSSSATQRAQSPGRYSDAIAVLLYVDEAYSCDLTAIVPVCLLDGYTAH